jgi:hypothetical protein
LTATATIPRKKPSHVAVAVKVNDHVNVNDHVQTGISGGELS